VGGPRQARKPIGQGKATNNLGFAEISLTTQKEFDLTNNPAGINSSWANNMYEDDSQINKGSTGYAINSLSAKNIKLFPDQNTGEYTAYLLPEKYVISNVTAGNYTFDPSFNTTLDLSQAYTVNTEIDSVLIDLTINAQGDTTLYYRVDSVQYQKNHDLIYRETPSVSNTVDRVGEDPVFWETEIEAKDGTVVQLVNGDGSLKTLYPVFKQRGKYTTYISVFEEYINVDNGNAIDKVPVTDGTVLIQNSLAINKDLQEFDLDGSGKYKYKFTGGLPNITTGGIGDYLLTMTVVVKTGQNGSILTPWEPNGESFKGYILGGMPTGNNFVSTGPKQLLNILRDPPGSNSYSYLEEGTESSFTSTTSISNEIAQSINCEVDLGARVVTWAGVGGGVITETETVANASVGWN